MQIVITGCTNGIGKALAMKFIELGHTVHGCGRSENAVNTLSKKYPKPHSFQIVDVGDNEGVAAWAKEVISISGAPDLLINNAGVINKNRELWKITDEDFTQVIDVNVRGVANFRS